MRKTPLILLVVLMGAMCSLAQDTTLTTFILVRHAEKADDGTKDPDLSPEGVKRAEALTNLLQNAHIDVVYTTNYKRTRNTVSPVARHHGLEIQVYKPGDAAAIEKMLNDHPGQTILIGGHSNTIPGIANQLLGEKQFDDFNENDYGNVLIVSVASGTSTASKVTRLRY